jgi:hypothetical protein
MSRCSRAAGFEYSGRRGYARSERRPSCGEGFARGASALVVGERTQTPSRKDPLIERGYLSLFGQIPTGPLSQSPVERMIGRYDLVYPKHPPEGSAGVDIVNDGGDEARGDRSFFHVGWSEQ